MLRPESRARARALQILYAWDLQGHPPIARVAEQLLQLRRGRGGVREWEGAEALAAGVAKNTDALDGEIAEAAAHWRLSRLGVVERNILRIGLYELEREQPPAPVVISEALRLTHWFAGAKAVPFVNGVLDSLARRRGRL